MNLRKVIQKTIRASGPGTEAVGSVNAAVTANVNEPGRTRTQVLSKQRIVQRGGRTHVVESERTTKEGPA